MERLRPRRLRRRSRSDAERFGPPRCVSTNARRSKPSQPTTTEPGERPAATPSKPSPAVAAEPLGIGTAGARDPLAAEVRLLGALLGQVISEQAGPELFATVERIRRRTIALRRDDDPLERARLDDELRAMDLEAAESVINAFALYFGLVNLAEARGRVRALRRRERAARDGVLDDSVADAVGYLRHLGRSNGELDALVGRLSIAPVLTAHPTEARRRTTLVALRRCAALLERLDDPRLTPSEDREIRRRLREEITLLWRASQLRIVTPTPLDEVRTAMAFFDATLFTVVPRLYRALDGALDGPGSFARACRRQWPNGHAAPAGRSLPAARELDRWRPRRQSRGDRRHHPPNAQDPGRPRSARLRSGRHPPHADDRGGFVGRPRPACPRVPARPRCRGPSRDRPRASPPVSGRALSTAVRVHRRAAPPDTGCARRRAGATTGRYADAADLETELTEIARLRSSPKGWTRVAWGEVAELRWQVGTFGFHLAVLEVRQHSAVHRAALAAIAHGRPRRRREVVGGRAVGEVLATFRAIARRPGALRRRSLPSVRRQLHGRRLGRHRRPRARPDRRVGRVGGDGSHQCRSSMWCRSSSRATALDAAGSILAALLDDPAYRATSRRGAIARR